MHHPRSTASRRQPATEQVLAFSRLCSRSLVKKRFLSPTRRAYSPTVVLFVNPGRRPDRPRKGSGRQGPSPRSRRVVGVDIAGDRGCHRNQLPLLPADAALPGGVLLAGLFPVPRQGGAHSKSPAPPTFRSSSSSHVREVTTIAHTLDARLANYASAAGDVTVAGSPFNGIPEIDLSCSTQGSGSARARLPGRRPGSAAPPWEGPAVPCAPVAGEAGAAGVGTTPRGATRAGASRHCRASGGRRASGALPRTRGIGRSDPRQ